jgi:hypothetical protein
VPNRGATVRRLSRQELVEHFQIRELLEGLAARLAAGAPGTHPAHARVRALHAELAADADAGRDFQDRELALHRLLLELGGSAQLARLVSRMHVPLSTAQVSQAMEPGAVPARPPRPARHPAGRPRGPARRGRGRHAPAPAPRWAGGCRLSLTAPSARSNGLPVDRWPPLSRGVLPLA